MKIIFNINNMQITMKKFKLDLEKMPLGKLSELQDAVDNGSSNNEMVGLSNKFFTLNPAQLQYVEGASLEHFKEDQQEERDDRLALRYSRCVCNDGERI
jgi:hypothetical protein